MRDAVNCSLSSLTDSEDGRRVVLPAGKAVLNLPMLDTYRCKLDRQATSKM
jgi:hypothetical protein